MASATPPTFRDTCERCGKAFTPDESRWLERRSYFVHTHCADWKSWEAPPYAWKLKELRKRYQASQGPERARIATAGQAIRAMQKAWPIDAATHVERVVSACRGL